jgi:GT2 family glycosyltransferase
MLDASDLVVVVPVHNRKSYTIACLESLARQSAHGFTTVVVDDGSTDGTSEEVRRLFPSTVLLTGDGSLWWSGATNLGVAWALNHDAQFVMTLNDDTRFGPELVGQLLGSVRSHPTSLIGALALDVESGAPVYVGEVVRWWSAEFISLQAPPALGDAHGLHEVTHFPGRGLMVPVEAYRRVGTYDAVHYPQAIADYDFTHRARRAGFTIYCDWDARIGMYPAESAGQKLRSKRSVANYIEHLFGIRGAGNLPRFVRYAATNAPWYAAPSAILVGVLRRVAGYLRDWARSEEGRGMS